MGERTAAEGGGSCRTGRSTRGRDRRDRSGRSGGRDRNTSGGQASRGGEAEAQGAREEAVDEEASRRENKGERRCVELSSSPSSIPRKRPGKVSSRKSARTAWR